MWILDAVGAVVNAATGLASTAVEDFRHCNYCGDLIVDRELRFWHVRQEHPYNVGQPKPFFCVRCGYYTPTEGHAPTCHLSKK